MTSFKQTIHAVQDRVFIVALFDIIFLILPGLTALFLYKNSLFQSLDWIKLILLSAAVTAPFAFVNTIIISASNEIEEKERYDGDMFDTFSLGIILSGLLVYAVMALNYFWDKSLHSGIIFVVVIEMALFLWVIIKEYWIKAKKYFNKKHKTQNEIGVK